MLRGRLQNCTSIMAAIVAVLPTQFRCVKQPLINIVRRDLAIQHAVQALSMAYIQCQCYHVTPVNISQQKRIQKPVRKPVAIAVAKKIYSSALAWEDITVRDLARSIRKHEAEIVEALSFVDTDRKYNPYSTLNAELLDKVVKVLGYRLKLIARPKEHTVETKEDQDVSRRPPPDPSVLVKRRPVVTIMGHVDHGKTTLLDALRSTSVVDSEFGGITQHIGAFNVKLKTGEEVTFLDTPGHAAFSTMRARGAQVTDIVVLVVAADDGVMEQTVESIRMAQKAGVPIIVAINKIDKVRKDVSRIQNELAEYGVLAEDLGGDVQCVKISALKQINLDTLTEAIVLQAEIMGIQGDPTGLVEGVVIECTTDLGRGKLATVLIQRGTLKKGAILVAGTASCKVRSMFDHSGQIIRKAGLSDPVQIIGWRELPSAGDEVLEVENESVMKMVTTFRRATISRKLAEEHQDAAAIRNAEHYKEYKKKLDLKRQSGRMYLPDTIQQEKQLDGPPKVNVVVKGDVTGSVEAILDVFDTYRHHDTCALNIVHYGVGAVNETDLELAETFDAIVYCFNTSISNKLQQEADKKRIKLRAHNVIYKLVDDIKNEISSRLPVVHVEEIIGEAEVLQKFQIKDGKKKVNVAGCRCTKGMLKKGKTFRLVRDGEVIFTGPLESLRHVKEEVEVIKMNTECGVRFEDPQVDVQAGDVLICFTTHEKPQATQWDTGF